MEGITVQNISSGKLTEAQKAEVRKAVVEHYKHKNDLQKTPDKDCFVCNNNANTENEKWGAIGNQKMLASFNPTTAMVTATGVIVAFEKCVYKYVHILRHRRGFKSVSAF